MAAGNTNTAAQFFHPSQQTTGRGSDNQMNLVASQANASNPNTSVDMLMLLSNKTPQQSQ